MVWFGLKEGDKRAQRERDVEPETPQSLTSAKFPEYHDQQPAKGSCSRRRGLAITSILGALVFVLAGL